MNQVVISGQGPANWDGAIIPAWHSRTFLPPSMRRLRRSNKPAHSLRPDQRSSDSALLRCQSGRTYDPVAARECSDHHPRFCSSGVVRPSIPENDPGSGRGRSFGVCLGDQPSRRRQAFGTGCQYRRAGVSIVHNEESRRPTLVWRCRPSNDSGRRGICLGKRCPHHRTLGSNLAWKWV
jgi:hypothetical protein